LGTKDLWGLPLSGAARVNLLLNLHARVVILLIRPIPLRVTSRSPPNTCRSRRLFPKVRVVLLDPILAKPCPLTLNQCPSRVPAQSTFDLGNWSFPQKTRLQLFWEAVPVKHSGAASCQSCITALDSYRSASAFRSRCPPDRRYV